MAVALSQNPGRPSFGKLLSRYRDAASLTQEGLAERSGLSVVTISALERGVRRAPYRDTVALLADALGLRDAARRQFEEAADGGRSRSVRADPSSSAAGGKLPWHPTSFVGRAQEIAELDELLRKHRLVTVIGSGGIGKTRTVLKVAERVAASRPSDVVFVDFAPLNDGVSVSSRIAGAIGVRSAGQADALTELINAVSARSVLLVFDNCEHVIDAAGVAAARLLESCPAIAVLATSRERLRIGGEVAYRLPVLPVPKKRMKITAAGGLSFAAIQLFVERATAVDPRFTLTDENAGAVADICYRVDGIPLAIELAAARVPTLGLSVLRSRLNEHFNILSGNSRDAPDRQQTLFKTIAWSYELLASSEQTLLRRLTVFTGGWTLEAAEAVCSDTTLSATAIADALSSLVEKCLVVVELDSEPTRYRLLESTRSFARRASQPTGNERLGDRHLAYYHRLFENSGNEYVGTLRQSIFTELERDLDNARAAINWAVANGDATSGAELFVATYLWYFCGLHSEEIALAERLLTLLPAQDVRLRSHLLGKAANAAFNTLQYERGIALSRSSIDAARQSGDAVALVTALGRLALFATLLGQLSEAWQALAELAAAIDEAERLGFATAYYRSASLEISGRLAAAEGDFTTAVAAFDRLARLVRLQGNRYTEIILILHHAELEHDRGDTAKAIVMLTETLSSAKHDLHKGVYANVLVYLAAFRAAAGDANGARDAARESIAWLAETGDDSFIAFAINVIALVLAMENKAHAACLLAGYSSAFIASAGLNLGLTGRSTNDRLNALLRDHYDAIELAERLAAGTKLTPNEAKAFALAN